MLRLVPDKIFERIEAITPALLAREGIRRLVLDIDNTMAPRDTPLPDETLLGWIKNVRAAGVRLFVLSNNRENRVSRFARALDLPYIYSGMKPFPRAFRRAVRSMELDRDEVAAVGDQIFTDVMGAHISGIRAWLVDPVDPRASLFYRFRRRFETPFLRRYYAGGGVLTRAGGEEQGCSGENRPKGGAL